MKTPRKSTIKRLAQAAGPSIVQHVQNEIRVDKPVKLTDVIPESICDKARRLAREDEQAKQAKRMAIERELLQAVLGDTILPPRAEDGTYEICGYIWKARRSTLSPSYYYLDCKSEYKGILLDAQNGLVTDPLSLGQALIRLDKRLAALKTQFPDTWWGNLKARFERLLA